jgi:putative addiction module killer protein
MAARPEGPAGPHAGLEARSARVAVGNFGDTGPVGEGVLELRIDWGPGYRVYFARRG